MALSSRNCCVNIAWRYIALVCFLGSLIAGLIPIGFGSRFVTVEAEFLGIINSGWWFLGFFWNIFVICWESVRKEAIHPGAVIGMDLITVLYGCGGAITWGVWSIVDVNFQYRWQFRWANIDRITYADRYQSMVCFSIFTAFAIISTIIHFTLFVIGCVHEDRRRKAIRAQAKNAKDANAAAAAKLEDGADGAQYGHGYYEAPSASARQSGAPSYLTSMNSAVAAKQAEIEEMEREFGNNNSNARVSSQYASVDEKARNW